MKNCCLVSVIIPIYNVKKYLDACMQSVINQSYNNLEIILIDDGSFDGSSDKCDKWAKLDERVRVVHKKNDGLFSARIEGFEMMKGEYFISIDGDDCIIDNYIENLLQTTIRDSADATLPEGYTIITEQGNKSKESISNLMQSPNAFDVFWQGVATKKDGWGFAGKLYKTSAYQKSRKYLIDIDEHISMGEDILITAILLYSVKKISRAKGEWGYHYLRHEGSIIAKGTPEAWIKKNADLTSVMFELGRFLIKINLYDKYKKQLSAFRKWQAEYVASLMYMESATKTAEINAKNLEIKHLTNEYQQLQNSKTYKLGKAIVAPVNFIRDATKKPQ